ncbi:MAG: hypothetical protein JNM63_11665, partial [Spirochaetia bacterium]|nr:hypothetical protein [Spirochaetia bacterium]
MANGRQACILLIAIFSTIIFSNAASAENNPVPYPDSYARVSIVGVPDGIELSPVSMSERGKNMFHTWRPENVRRMGLEAEFLAKSNTWSEGWISFKPSKDGNVRVTLFGPYVLENGKKKKILMVCDEVALDGAGLVNGNFETRNAEAPKGWSSYYPDNNKGDGPRLLEGRGVNGSSGVMTWHDGVYYQDVAVKKDETLTLRVKVRLADAFDVAQGEGTAVPLDLRSSANMGFADEVAGDGKGGWSDQGPDNDLRSFDPRRSDFGGVPFRIIAPEKNQGRSVMSFRGAMLSVQLYEARIDLPRAAAAKNLYILHTTCFNQTKTSVGTVTVEAEGGAKKIFDIKSGREVADWWGAGSLSNGVVVFRQPNRSTAVGLYLSRLELGEEMNVRSVTFQSAGGPVWIVVGATLSTKDIPLPVEKVWKPQAGDEWKLVDLS